MRPRAHAAVGAALLAVLVAPAETQVAVSIKGMASQVQSTALVAGEQEAVSGLWFGGGGEIELGPVTLAVHTMAGRMEGTASTGALARDGGEIRGALRLSPVSWLAVEAGHTFRAFSSAVGYQEWQLTGAGIVIAPRLGDRALRAYVSGAFLPSVSVAGRDAPELGLAAEAGLRVAPRGAPITIAVAYRFERYDFPSANTVVVEQFDQLTVGVGVRLGAPAR